MTIEYDHQAQMAQVSFDQLLNFELVTVSQCPHHKMLSNLAKSELLCAAPLKLLDHKLSVSQTISNNYNQCNK